MTTRTVERVDDWNTRPFDGGYPGLRELADREFSGVVRSGAATLCMLRGRVVGILGGSIEDFEDADGTAYEAPSPALPLLIVMQERSEEVRAKYYTEDTPLSQVDRTLADGGFTGYVELSENVISGDYYTVYHAGRSMSVAFLGESARLETGSEAFDLADDEVGIYEVRPVDIDIIDIPAPEPETSVAAAGAASGMTDDAPGEATDLADAGDAVDEPAAAEPETAESTASSETRTDSAEEPTDGDAAVDAETGQETTETPETRPDAGGTTASREADDGGTTAPRESETGGTDETTGTVEADPPGDDDTTAESGTTPADEPASRPERAEPERPADGTGTEPSGGASEPGTAAETGVEPTQEPTESRESRASTDSTVTSGTVDPEPTEVPDRRAGSTAGTGAAGGSSGGSADAVASEPAESDRPEGPEALETHAVPSLDPARSGNGEDGSTAATDSSGGPSTGGRTAERVGGRQSNAADAASTGSANGTRKTAGRRSDESEVVSELRAELDERTQEISRLKSELQSAREERDRLADEREELRERVERLEGEREELRERVERLRTEREDLQSEIDDLRAEPDGQATAAPTGTDMGRREALEGTNLFVRYESKGKATLEAAHDGAADRDEVNRNLKLEYHTQFDADEATVDGRAFDEFFVETMEYRFVDWLVHDLLYEIRDTGKTAALETLYDALPRTDRIQLYGEVPVTYEEEGERHNTEETFDVVVRDRMGDPIVVANLNDSRLEAGESMMTSLIQSSSRVCENKETLAAAFLVTRSFFEPEALEVADEATGGGLLSRDKRQSFVKTSRKRGYHLCLAEGRSDEFHMTVPEL